MRKKIQSMPLQQMSLFCMKDPVRPEFNLLEKAYLEGWKDEGSAIDNPYFKVNPTKLEDACWDEWQQGWRDSMWPKNKQRRNQILKKYNLLEK